MKNLSILFLSLFFFTSCDKENIETTEIAEKRIVVVGNTFTSTDPDIQKAVIWENGIEKALPVGETSGKSVATAVSLHGDEVLTVGYFPSNNKTYYDEPFLLSNSELKYSLLDTSAYGNYTCSSVFVTNDDIYISGNFRAGNNRAMYWKNGTPVYLSHPGGYRYNPSSFTTSIYVSNNNDIYVSGGTSGGYISIGTFYWKNGEVIILDKGKHGHTSAVVLNNNKVYVVGANNSGRNAIYWVDGVEHQLSKQTYSSANSIAVNATEDVYVCGESLNENYKNMTALLWKNGEEVNLEGATSNSRANSVFCDGEDVYVVGHIDNNGTSQAALWINGKLTKLGETGLKSTANGIYVK